MKNNNSIYVFNVYTNIDDINQTKKEIKIKATDRAKAYEKINKKYPFPFFAELYTIKN